MLKGIDVSFHKGYPDWSKARAEADFAILGVTELYGKDASFEHNYKGCRENGIPMGAYKFSYARSWSDSKNEAMTIVDILNGRPLEMGIWLDLEWDVQATFPDSLRADIIEGFRQGVEEGGYTFGGIYCNRYWYDTFIPSYAKSRYRFWIASYPSADYGKVIDSLKPTGVKNLSGWQYSENGSIPGFGAQGVDLDVWYDDIATAPALPEAPQEGQETTQRPERVTLCYGNSGEAVKDLQEALNRLGYHLDEDGIFGSLTKAAVTSYQAKEGLDPDGIVGPLTWEKIDNQLAALNVWAGKYGDDPERREALRRAGYDPDAVQEEVNVLDK